MILRAWMLFTLCVAIFWSLDASAQVLNKQQMLDAQTFWDNQDWDWYQQNIPFFECPDPDIATTYYYRWELLTNHLAYGSPNSGYSFTEFIDRPFWSGAYGAISCPAGHQLYEARWLRSPRIANDYTRYWFRTQGAQPRNYSTWLADSAWAVNLVHRDDAIVIDLLPDLVRNYEAWEHHHFVPEVGLFWQTGHDDGMEFNINSRQTKDILRGAPSFRPSFNAYMWADATAIARIADLAGDAETAKTYREKADALKDRLQTLLWDPKREFFFPMFRDDEERDGHTIKSRTLTYQTGQFAGDPHGRELIGYVPWQFDLLDRGRGYEVAWKKLMDREAFFAEFGPTTVERNDPMFLLQKSCCWWSGQSWPYATTQTLKALANVLQTREQSAVAAEDYVKLLAIYARSHRKNGKPYLAEALHPDTGSFEGHDGYNHSEHYFHSGYCDLVITGLAGLVPRDNDTLEINPLAPARWDYFALDDVPYRGNRVSILWDKIGNRYGHGAGLHVLLNGKKLASSLKLERLVIKRMSQQLSFRFPRERSISVGPERSDKIKSQYAEMQCKGHEVVYSGTACGEIASWGDIVDQANGEKLASFRQTVRVWRGTSTIDIDVELSDVKLPDGDPWNNYFASRFAWGDSTAAVTRSIYHSAQPFSGERFETSDYIEIASESERLTIVPHGLPFHRQTSERMVDSLLIVAGETERRFRFTVAIDEPYPLEVAWNAAVPAPTIPTDRGQPRTGLTGWFFHVDARHVQITRILDAPNSDTVAAPLEQSEHTTVPRDPGFTLRLIETEGRSKSAQLRCFRRPTFARKRNFHGETINELIIQNDAVLIDVIAYEIVDIEIRFGG